MRYALIFVPTQQYLQKTSCGKYKFVNEIEDYWTTTFDGKERIDFAPDYFQRILIDNEEKERIIKRKIARKLMGKRRKDER